MSPAPIPETMLAATYHRHGAPSRVVRVESIPAPTADELKPGQLLVRVRAAALNPADWKTAAGDQNLLLSFQWPRVYGMDFEGEVVAAASGDDHAVLPPFVPGDSVFGMIRGLPEYHRGTLAEYVIVEAEICAKTPANVNPQDAASVPLVGITRLHPKTTMRRLISTHLSMCVSTVSSLPYLCYSICVAYLPSHTVFCFCKERCVERYVENASRHV